MNLSISRLTLVYSDVSLSISNLHGVMRLSGLIKVISLLFFCSNRAYFAHRKKTRALSREARERERERERKREKRFLKTHFTI